MGTIRLAILFTIAALCLQAQASKGKSAALPGALAPPPIEARDVAEDPPELKRRYTAKLTSKPRITLTLECEDNAIWKERRCIGTLMQPDEKAVSFTVGGRYEAYDSIADEILDQVIVPETKRLAAEMHRQDARWRAVNADAYKDTNGQYWSKK